MVPSRCGTISKSIVLCYRDRMRDPIFRDVENYGPQHVPSGFLFRSFFQSPRSSSSW